MNCMGGDSTDELRPPDSPLRSIHQRVASGIRSGFEHIRLAFKPEISEIAKPQLNADIYRRIIAYSRTELEEMRLVSKEWNCLVHERIAMIKKDFISQIHFGSYSDHCYPDQFEVEVVYKEMIVNDCKFPLRTRWDYDNPDEAVRWSRGLPLYVHTLHLASPRSDRLIDPRLLQVVHSLFRDVIIGKLLVRKSLLEEDRDNILNLAKSLKIRRVEMEYTHCKGENSKRFLLDLASCVEGIRLHQHSDCDRVYRNGVPIHVESNYVFGLWNEKWSSLIVEMFGRRLSTLEIICPRHQEMFADQQEVSELVKIFVEFTHPCVTFMDVFPQIVHFDPLFGYPIKRYYDSFKASEAILQKEIDITEASLNVDEEPRCYADSFFIEMKRREAKGEPLGTFTRHQLNLAALDMWSAGFETTVTTMRFGIHFLMSSPVVQHKMQQEIDEKIGQRQISMEDQKLLPYCMATIHEIQRAANIGEINFFRETNQEVTIAGHKIPAGTAILPQFPSVHVDPEHFERPDYFCPERHINDAGEFVKDPKITPFSFGKRACLGEGLARMELFIFLTTFVQHCSFSSPSLIPPKLETIRGLTRSPVPYKVKITARI